MSTIITRIRSTQFTLALSGVVPAVCDAEAGESARQPTDVPLREFPLECGPADQSYLTRLFRKIAGPLTPRSLLGTRRIDSEKAIDCGTFA
jgi:hypothetical protein